jgi:putative transposase
MPEYRRLRHPGGSFFFTLTTFQRSPWLCEPAARELMRAAIQKVRRERPFHIDAWVTLPEHIHCIWTLPEGEEDYSERWRLLKRAVSAELTPEVVARFEGGVQRYRRLIDPAWGSRKKRGERMIWHRRFWEHMLRDDRDYAHHCDYIHYNPVKHGHVTAPVDWPWSSFHRFVRQGIYPPDWAADQPPDLPDEVGHE